MEAHANHWLPLTEYALRSGMSISTLRRKIKSSSIEFKMEEGRYLIRSDDLTEAKAFSGYSSSDAPILPRIPTSQPIMVRNEMLEPATKPAQAPIPTLSPVPSAPPAMAAEVAALREEIQRMQGENRLCWRAIEARVSGLAKNLEIFSEQIAEAKMLVKIFEEKLDHRA